MQLQQVNFTYFPIEDRILMRIVANEEDEIRIWLTRKSLSSFVPQSQSWINQTDGTPQSAVKSFAREQAAVNADTSKPFREGKNFPLGETPNLASALIIETEQGYSRIIIDFANNQRLTLNLAEEALAGIQKILNETITAANWNLAKIQNIGSGILSSTTPLTKH